MIYSGNHVIIQQAKDPLRIRLESMTMKRVEEFGENAGVSVIK
jgi:hypothetical protein